VTFRDDDVVSRVLGALEPDRSHSTTAHILRLVLVALAIVLAMESIAPLLFGVGTDAPEHTARHLGAYGLALATGFLYTALRPRRAGALVPVAAVLSIALAMTATGDVLTGRTQLLSESGHVVELIALVVLWMLVRLERPRRAAPPRLKPVEDSRSSD
jgi:hypothetical protein